ncbi:MAG: hypothetical protein K2G90_09965 [Muribaculaceae bacterium]|nr:hypothetical protein [Muribaculaceae bacterium]
MNSKFTYISLAFALALSACRSDDTPPPAPEYTEENPAYMSFSLTMENPTGQTKATRGEAPDLDGTDKWGDLYEQSQGTAFDIRLLPDNFTAVILENDNKTVVGNFNILSYWTSSTESTVTYFIHGSFAPKDTQKYPTTESLKQGASGMKLMVFANTPSDPLGNPAADGTHDFSLLEFPYISKTSALEAGEDVNEPGFPAIPMWGVCPVDFSNLKQGSFTWINDENSSCQLLRAMAKVSVQLKLGENQKNRVKLVSLALNKYNTKGYVTPGTWDEKDLTSKILFDETLRENPSEATNYISQRVSVIDGEDNISFYLPEIKNDKDAKRTLTEGPDSEDCLELTLKYAVDGNEKENHLYFTKYSGGGPVSDPQDGKHLVGLWDVVRNHIYEYTITGVQDSKINIEARVKDWQYHKAVQPLE